MAKVLLVEDDSNLREIFEMRLQAEGYETSVASDGEEALMIALKQKPDLVIADVMMPKMSGFEMLETLRATPDTANIKVIMMTALGQAEDRSRGEKLGVVKYLVKSQVTLEDFVRTVKEVLGAGSDDKASQTGDQSNATNVNNKESEKVMDDQNANTPMPGGGDAGGGQANPMGGSDMGGDQMSTSQQQDAVNQQVNDAMGGDSGAAAGGGDSGGGSDVPMGTPPADAPAGGDGSAAPAGGDTPANPDGEGGQTPPTAPGGM